MTKKRVLLSLLVLVIGAVIVVTALGRNRGEEGIAVDVAGVGRLSLIHI